jgi:hypothetical protein
MTAMKRTTVAAVLLGFLCCPACLDAGTQIGRAKMDIKNIEKACELYKAQCGAYPESLAKLTDAVGNEAALLKEEALCDPWKRPYHYERDQRHPKTGIPEIWSEGDDPTDPTRRITNFRDSPPPRTLSFWEMVREDLVATAILLFTITTVVALACVAFHYRKGDHLDRWVGLTLLALVLGLIATFVWKQFTAVMV